MHTINVPIIAKSPLIAIRPLMNPGIGGGPKYIQTIIDPTATRTPAAG
jgi:hypothetical protein